MVSLTVAAVFGLLAMKYRMNQINEKRYLREVEFSCNPLLQGWNNGRYNYQ